MTILSEKKNKGSSSKNQQQDVDSGEHGHNSLNSLSHQSLPHDSHAPLQSESIGLSTDRLYVGDRQSSSIWSHGQPLSNPREDKRSGQSFENLDNSHVASKRRHRVSPLRSTRSKHSRVERERERPNSTPTPNSVPILSTCVTENLSSSSKTAPHSPIAEKACNSEDEYDSSTTPTTRPQLAEEEWVEKERRFEKKIRKKDMIIKQMGEDGACLFRAVADQVYGDQEMHPIVRKHCMDYIAANRDYFSQYVTEDFSHYVNRKRLDYVHGNHVEIQALSEMYNRTIEVFCYGSDPINIFHGTPQTDNEPIRLSYHRGVHYNSIVDPFKATIGVGLGLPDIPGLADKNLMKDATRQSEENIIEQAMLEDKLMATDWEATNEAIEEQVSRESYLQWLKDNERRNRHARSPTASSSASSTVTSATAEIRSPRRSVNSVLPESTSFRNSPPPSIPSTSNNLGGGVCGSGPKSPNTTSSSYNPPGGAAGGVSKPSSPNRSPEHKFEIFETNSFINQLPPEIFGLTEWEDSGLLAKVLATSQQEYLDQLKQNSGLGGGGGGGGGEGSSEGEQEQRKKDGDFSSLKPNL